MVPPITCVAYFALCLLSFLLILRYVLYFLFDFLSFEFLVFSFSLHFLLVSSVLMVGYSEIQQTSPSVAFLFARLGALLESSVKSLVVLPPVGTYPPIGGYFLIVVA